MSGHYLFLLASSKTLSIAHIEKLERFCEEHALGLNGAPEWLEPHLSARLPVQNAPDMVQIQKLRLLFEHEKIDVLCRAINAPPVRLFLADMDATIVEGETLDELAGHAGLKDQIAAITTRAMNGDLDFKAALRERVALLRGLPITALHETLAKTKLTEGAKDLVRHLKSKGVACVLVSGGFTFFTQAIADQCGFDHHHGNILNLDGVVLDGTVADPILDKDAKLNFLKSYTIDLGIDLSQTLAIGDGANDLPMLAAAGIGIGYRAKPLLRENLTNILAFSSHIRLCDFLPV